MKLPTEKVAAAMRCTVAMLSRELRARGIAFEFVRGERGQLIEIADDDMRGALSSLLPRARPVAKPVKRRQVLALSATQAKALSLTGVPHSRRADGGVDVDAALLDCAGGQCCERELSRVADRLIADEPLGVGTIRERRARRDQLRKLAALSLSRKSASVAAIRSRLKSRPVARSVRPVGEGAARFAIRGEIDSTTSREFLGWLDSLLPGAAIHVELDSAGGEVFPSFSIFDAVRAWQGPTSVLIRNAMSAASFVALAFDDRAISENGFVMLHSSHVEDEPSPSVSTMLAKIDGGMAGIYHRHLSLSRAEIDAAMESELWLTAAEAVAAGFASRILVS